jgi:hypothetical protein
MKTRMSHIERAQNIFNAGFTTKADMKSCLDLINRSYEDIRETVTSSILDLRNEGKMEAEVAHELYNSVPYGLHQFRSKHADAIKSLFPEEVVAINELVAFRNQAKDASITPKVSKAAVARAAVAEISKSSNNKIELAVMPLKEAAVARAEQEAREMVVRCTTKLAAANFDLSIVAPYPTSRLGYPTSRLGVNEYHMAMGKRSMYLHIVKHVSGSRRHNDPEIVTICPESVERFIKNTKEDAAMQYDEFVSKLVAKIGKVTDASLFGNHVWSFSLLTVTKEDGTKEVWKTQMIVNVSKLGKLFNQWPTRKVKK